MLDGMTCGTVFNAGHDYPNVETSPGLSPADARIELLFIEGAPEPVNDFETVTIAIY